MAFLDDLSKKLTQAGQTAVQKTKEMTDIARINSMIAEEERVINDCYNKIGKLYVSLHGTDYEDAFAELCFTVQRANLTIEGYRKQIETIKNAGRCSKCGSEIVHGAAFCSACGASVQKGEQTQNDKPSMYYCAGCGAVISKDARFCTSCGKATTCEASQPQPDNITESPVEKKPGEKKCPGCGVEVDDKLLYCLECGTKLK